ncbi:MAG: hypothetical protein KME17_27445 [Cyanosarcina radialis HA8281-LM2]|nr:hypothetical protein [Cyanosarcina radialis HA8281-LM2]
MPHEVCVQETKVLYYQTKLVLRANGFMQSNSSWRNSLPIIKVLYRPQSLRCSPRY